MDSWIASISMEVFCLSLEGQLQPPSRPHPQNYVRALDGCTPNEVVRPIRRKILVAEVEAYYKKPAYKGKRKKVTARFRSVCIRHLQSGPYHGYITNIPPGLLSAQAIVQIYAAQ